MASKVLTVEEAKKLGPPTEAELAARAAVLETTRRAHEEYLAAGGHVMTNDEFDRFWAELDTESDDDYEGPDPGIAK